MLAPIALNGTGHCDNEPWLLLAAGEPASLGVTEELTHRSPAG